MKTSYATLLLLFGLSLSSPLRAATLSGKVTDPDGQTVSGASVIIPALGQHVHTDASGTFRFNNLPKGVFVIKIQKDGLPSRVMTADLREKDADLAVALEVAFIKADTVVISGFRPADEGDFAQAVSVIEGKKLDRARGQSLMETVQEMPGVANFSTGNAIGKPVIRGLASYRSLVMVDGVPEESQQFGDEHGPNMDILDMQRVEIVRGPGSLLFGSGALGGVMNVITPELPSAAQGSETLSARIVGNAFSNNPGGAGAIGLSGTKGNIGYRGTFSYREAGNTRTPDGAIPNSAYKNLNGSTLVGISEKWGMLSLRFAHYDTQINLPQSTTDTAGKLIANPDATTYQKVAHDRLHLKGMLHSEIAKFELNLSYQQNRRREFESAADADPRLNLVLDTLNTEIKAHHAPVGPLIGTIGFNYINQRNQTLGTQPLIPGYESHSYGAFLFEELRFDAFSILGGVRGDTRILHAKENAALSLQDETVQNSAATGSVGAVWRFMKGASAFANLGRGFRAPTAFELFSNGVHEGAGTFDIGNRNLKSETSLTTDIGVKWRRSGFHFEIGGYYNKISNYIFNAPTGNFFNDPETGSLYAEYRTTQGDATIYGAELDGEYEILKWLAVSGGFDIVRGRNDSLNEPLALIPANRYRVGITFSQNKLGAILNPYLAIKARYVARKTEISSQESTQYSGFADYTVVSASTGGDFPVGGQIWTYTIGADNLLNQRYVDYLNRQKLFALNPGVNVFLKITAPIDLIH
ncbi:MAG: TonB-dependent receptor [Turneriella sp.]|nr:TonB-dependent receptor [Turneriella sp.]